MPSPTTDVASNQRSQLAHPSYFSNPAPMKLALPWLHLDTISLPTPTRFRRRRREPSPSPPAHINAHALRHTLHTFYLPLPLPPHTHDPPYFYAIMSSLSFKIFNGIFLKKKRIHVKRVEIDINSPSCLPSQLLHYFMLDYCHHTVHTYSKKVSQTRSVLALWQPREFWFFVSPGQIRLLVVQRANKAIKSSSVLELQEARR